MSKYEETIEWKNSTNEFKSGNYSRKHTWIFDGGIEVPASSSPSVVPLPYSEEKAIDPEEAFLCSISSCHMLWFLDLAAKEGLNIKSYVDEANGIMGNKDGKKQITIVNLHPKIELQNEEKLDKSRLKKLHTKAHEKCFIANSVTSKINTIL
ncbi:MAG: peroxiredoxin [Bacteroidetes bacterium]|jgi:organic hydroperoxide reductase OsmC/OhrA|nr:peroxiredoxin [Bacteroidota bacterium]